MEVWSAARKNLSRRRTQQRWLIMQIIQASEGHLDADEIYQQAYQNLPGTARSVRSIYRIRESILNKTTWRGGERHAVRNGTCWLGLCVGLLHLPLHPFTLLRMAAVVALLGARLGSRFWLALVCAL